MGKLSHQPKCPNCGKLLDGFTAMSDPGTVPTPGSVTVCAYCAVPLEFTEGLNLQVLDMDKLDSGSLAELRRAILVVRSVLSMQERRN